MPSEATWSDITGSELHRLLDQVGVSDELFALHGGRPVVLVRDWIAKDSDLPAWIDWILYSYLVLPNSRTYPERIPLPVEEWSRIFGVTLDRREVLAADRGGPLCSLTNRSAREVLRGLGVSVNALGEHSGLSYRTAGRYFTANEKSPAPIWVDWALSLYWQKKAIRILGIPPVEDWPYQAASSGSNRF